MTEISRYVPGPYNGISQVPPQVRLEGTCESMSNCVALIPNGLQKRPPFEYLARLFASACNTDCLFAEIPTGDATTDVCVVFNNVAGVVTPSLFKVSDGTPVACAVTAAAQTYLNLNNPSPVSDLYLKTVEDVTFVANRKVVTAINADAAPTRPNEAILWVKIGAYSRIYAVTVTPATGTPVTCSYRPHDGTAGASTLGVGTDRIAKGLYDGTIVATSGAVVTGTPLNTLTSQGFTVTLAGSAIYISHPTVDFTITSTDDQGGTAMAAIKDSVQRFSDLPAVAQDGFTVQIAQEVVGGNSDYFVKFVPSGSTSTGIWEEVLEPGAPRGLDVTTMPVAIKNTAGVWTCETLPWTRRTTGNLKLSPDPDFIGSAIQALAWWRGRLVLVYHGGEYLSASDDPYKFYTSTLTTVVASDPIGLLTPADTKTFFKDVGVVDRQLVAFADRVQAITNSDVVPKPGEVRFEQVGDSEFAGGSPIQSAGKKLYFTTEDSAASHVFEMAVDRLSGLIVPEDMTVSVPTLLPIGLRIASTRKKDFFTVRAAPGATVVYTHTFRHADQQRVQNAWATWNMPPGLGLCGAFFKGAKLYALGVNLTTKAAYLFILDISQGRVDPAGRVLTYLDWRISSAALATPTYAGGNTTFTLPYPVTASTIATVRGTQPSGSANPEGSVPEVTFRTATTITLLGDWRTGTLWFGEDYAASFVPSQWFQVGADERPILTGTLNLMTLHADVARFSALDISVSVRGRATRTVPFEGNWQDDTVTPLDVAPASPSRRLTLPLGGPSEDVSVRFSCNSHRGFHLLGYEWVGDWTQRGIKRVS